MSRLQLHQVIGFPFPLRNVVPGCLKSFFQLDHRVDSSPYLTHKEATAVHYSRVLTFLTPPWRGVILSPISMLASCIFH